MKQEILKHYQIEQKIQRLAHQILENTVEEKKIFLGGIVGNGSILAKLIYEIAIQHSSQEIKLFELKLNKHSPLSSKVELSIPMSELENGYVLLVDDVLNSGKTMQYALVKLLEQSLKTLKTVALVDRLHRKYPIKADFVGLSLSTTLKEHVVISLANGKFGAYLE